LTVLAAVILVLVLAFALARVFVVIWAKGGPQPVHQIVIAIPAPQMPPAAGRRA
jgi:hypothetical protein